MNKKSIRRAVASALFIAVTLFALQRLLEPKYAGDVIEGNLIAEYYAEPKDHDVIFIGDCEVYENFSPNVLWEDFGINSYIRGSAQQLIWQSYYLLEDTLRYEKPKVVVFNVLSLKYNEPQSEAYNRMSLEGMRWSLSKVGAIRASMTREEHFLDYVFPILRYHSRWSDLGADDVRYLFSRKQAAFNGYAMRTDVKPAESVPEGKVLADYRFGDQAMQYLDRITRLCEENDIQLLLVKAPSLYPYWYDEWESQVEAYAQEHDLRYLNFLELIDETGLDFSRDTYDGGLHLNVSGAEKITEYLGTVLRTEYGLADRRSEEPLRSAWEEKSRAYEAEKLRQKEEGT